MKTEAHGKSHVGLIRAKNEDSYYLNLEKGIFIICDGIGGEKAGEVASCLAIDKTSNYIQSRPDEFEACTNGSLSDEEIFAFFSDAVIFACSAVYEMSLKSTQYNNMGTTLTMAITLKTRVLICHVGDSRAYLVNSLGVHQISEDHTLAKDFIQRGLIENEDDSPRLKNILSKSLGSFPSVEVDCSIVSVSEGDKIVLCSDGISNYFKSPEELGALISGKSSEDAANTLVEFALNNKGEDNASAIVVDILDENLILNPDLQLNILIANKIHGCPVFKKISYSQAAKMRSYLDVISLSKGDVFLEKLEKVNGFYIVIKGSISSSGQTFSEGEGIGLQGLVSSHHSSSEKIAEEDTVLVFFSKAKFNAFSKKHPQIAIRIFKNIFKLIVK
ncbi:MAG: protein phosphatase 2C domain-containing protein [Lentisphaeraceae bacterium]|nr:protein phosphatase 2C domain-containing protein [Lentisphaeraceae bacterium]